MGQVIRVVLTIIIVDFFILLTLAIIYGGPWDKALPGPSWFWWSGVVSFPALMLMRVWRRA